MMTTTSGSDEKKSILSATSEEDCPRATEHEQKNVSPTTEQPNPYAGFDPYAGTNWLYPIDFTTPEYLPHIAERVLRQNSMIILPNKFEKTFITAVTMYNVYRWYPLAKIVYMTSKRLLVQEQQSACQRFVRFSPMDVTEMNMKPKNRMLSWISKRVIFITSHMMVSELKKMNEDVHILDKIKLVVIDEPQTDNGLHANIIRKISENNQNFRVMCVSLTSSKTIEIGMLKEWLITKIELQWGNPNEAPQDWLMNKKEISNISTPPGPSLSALLIELASIGEWYVKNIRISKFFSNAMFEDISVTRLKQERERYEQSILTGVLRSDHHDIMLNFHLAEMILQAYRILKQEGILAFLEFHQRSNDIYVQNSQEFVAFVNKLRHGMYTTPHPKFQTLEKFLGEFIQRRRDARILIVVERKDAAGIIHRNLQKLPGSLHRLLIDSDYLREIERFRAGKINILIVTVQNEPAIDVGETDLIVLFNMPDHPREFLAHIARTRGATPGAIIILTTEGSEEQEINEIINTRRMYYFENRNILPIGIDFSNMMVQNSSSLIPPGFQPTGRYVLFDKPIEMSNNAVPTGADPPSAGKKRKLVEVLSDKPGYYDAVNGQTFYEVVQINQQQHSANIAIDETQGREQNLSNKPS